jgi:tetratricopeptide (TPR) repeat protein
MNTLPQNTRFNIAPEEWDSLEFIMNRVLAAEDLNNYQEAGQLLEEVIAKYPHYRRGLHEYANLLMVDTAGIYQTRAIFFTRKMIKAYPQDPFFQYLMGMHFVLHPKPGYRAKGVRYLKNALKLDPEMMMAWWGLGYYYLAKGEYEAARRYLMKAFHLGFQFQPGEVEEEFDITEMPPCILIHDLACCYEGLGQLSEAIEYRKLQILSDPYHSAGYRALAEAYEEKQMWKEALQAWEEMLARVTPETRYQCKIDWEFVPRGLEDISRDLAKARKRIPVLRRKLNQKPGSI